MIVATAIVIMTAHAKTVDDDSEDGLYDHNTMEKRQGVFGPCQGWGAGCGPNYSSSSNGRSQGGSRGSGKSRLTDVSLVPDGSYLFTSGEYSWYYLVTIINQSLCRDWKLYWSVLVYLF